MKKLFRLYMLVLATASLAGCEEAGHSDVEVILFNPATIADIESITDTSYVEKVGSVNVFERHVYRNRKSGQEWRISKDADGHVSSVIQYENGQIAEVQEYFPNGQLCGLLPPMQHGSRNGEAKYFHPNGRVKSIGLKKNNLSSGQWKNYDENGNLISIEEYKEEGSLLPEKVTKLK